NPHYWIPPKNARAVARLIAQRLSALDAAGAASYQAALSTVERRLDAKEKEWAKTAAPLRGMHIVTYHKSWSYLAGWLGLQEMRYVGPTRVIAPTANPTPQRSA